MAMEESVAVAPRCGAAGCVWCLGGRAGGMSELSANISFSSAGNAGNAMKNLSWMS